MSTVILEKLPLPVARAIRAGKRLRITTSGQTIATVEPQKAVPAVQAKPRRSKLTAEQWIATVAAHLSPRPDLDAAKIVRAARDRE